MTLIKISSLLNTPPSSKTILFENIVFGDTFMASSLNLIDTEGISTSRDITFIFRNLTFSNIGYADGGNLMNLGHLLSTQVVIQDSTFNNLTSAGIVVGGALGQQGLRSKVKIIDSKFSDYSSNSYSFISTYSGSELEIRN